MIDGPDGATGGFGVAVASAGDVDGDGYGEIIAGNPLAGGGIGRAHVYRGTPSGLATSPALTLEGPDGSNGYFGAAVAGAGDVNRDGYADVVVGAFGVDGFAGRAYVFFGSAAGLARSAAVTLRGPDGAGGNFGATVAATDFNGDGASDVVVGAAQAASGAGRVYVYLGTPVGLPSTPSNRMEGADGAGAAFGAALAVAGDVDGDGFAALVVGAPQAMGMTGRGYVFRGGFRGVSTTAAAAILGPDGGGGLFGSAVAGAGDLDGDGQAEVVIAATGVDRGAGRAYVYRGDEMTAGPRLTLRAPDGAGSAFGASLAGGRDVNGDGFADLVVGAHGVASNVGRAYLFAGRAGGLGMTPAVTLDGDGVVRWFGRALAQRAWQGSEVRSAGAGG